MRPFRTITWGLGTLAAVAVMGTCSPRAGGQPQTEHKATPKPAPFSPVTLPKLAGGSRVGQGVPPFWVRPGYRCDMVAQLDEVRFLCLNPEDGTLYVAQPGHGKIAMLRPDGAGYKRVGDFVTGHPSAHGMYWFKGWLWFTESGAIFKARSTDGKGAANEVQTIIAKGQLPSGGHWWRPILVDDTGFYTEIGDSGNISDEMNTDRQKIWRYNLDGGDKTLFASGLRNTEKLLFKPGTNEVWGVDHGSDNFGHAYGETPGKEQPITDEIPGEKFNHYVRGGFYGHPYFVAGRVPRPEYANKPDLLEWADRVVMPALSYGAHWAPNGWCFYTKDAIPGAKGDAFMAFHGSWNRVKKGGYRIERTTFDQVTGQPYGSYMILGTVGEDDKTLARPTDVIEAPDGSLLWSDDSRARIYRITYTGK